MKRLNEHLPEWIEAGVIVLTLVIGAIAAASVTYYKVDQISHDITTIKINVADIPILVERVSGLEKDVDRLENEVAFIRRHNVGVQHGKERGN